MKLNAAEIVGVDEQGFGLSPRRRAPRSVPPHRLVLGLAAVLLFGAVAAFGRWNWLPAYLPEILSGIGVSMVLLAVSGAIGFLLAIPIGFVQVKGRFGLAILARWFCILIRGTPLLLQLWLLYYGLGSLFPGIPWIRSSVLWPFLRQAWPYAVVSLTLSFAGYVGEVMRGAFAGVPRDEIEAARAVGMSSRLVFRRVWLPLAIHRVLPTLLGETVLQLKATPLVATITVLDVFAVIGRVRQETYVIYEPLLLLAAIYCGLTGLLVLLFRFVETRIVAANAQRRMPRGP